ncbi:MAG: zinc-ribbon domain-containing protein [Candidatus Lokiarchaeota archaeon]|nr:zinc-ribbon domain-containing protein [Candidatus Lokiarchaeota archaeon]
MTKKKEEESSKQALIGSWTGFLSTTLIFMLLGAFLFDWAWWVFFVPGMTLIGSITTTINYFTVETKKCGFCGARLEKNALFCRTCGNKIVTKCPKCGVDVSKSNTRYCPKCGADIYEGAQLTKKEESEQKEKQEDPKLEPQAFSYCPACGMKIKSGSKICPSCGIEL